MQKKIKNDNKCKKHLKISVFATDLLVGFYDNIGKSWQYL
jgi:hypothetical protein